MKKILATICFVILSCITTLAQNENLQCPKVEIDAPKSVVQEGEIITFSVSNKFENNNIEYKWSVDKGKIIKGQGTSKIEVDTKGFDYVVINANLEISNLPLNCKNSFFESGVVATIKDYFPNDEYGNLSLKDELARLDAFLSELIINPEFQGYVVMSYKEREPNKKAHVRIRKLVKHLKRRGFPANRITLLLDKNSNEDKTVLWRFPKNADFTQCENCEIIKGSEIK